MLLNSETTECFAIRDQRLKQSLGTVEGAALAETFGPPDSECVRVAKAVKKALDAT